MVGSEASQAASSSEIRNNPDLAPGTDDMKKFSRGEVDLDVEEDAVAEVVEVGDSLSRGRNKRITPAGD